MPSSPLPLKILRDFEPISLEEMDDVELQNRIDSKYIIHLEDFVALLPIITPDYYLLQINDKRYSHYKTVYFDTPEYRFYKDHHNDLPRRIKARKRSYLDSDLHFFEVKRKRNSRTKKYRKKLEQAESELKANQREKIKKFYTGTNSNVPKEMGARLKETLINRFTRITLVNKAKTERCTLDLNLSFSDPLRPDRVFKHPDLVIVEVKQGRLSTQSAITAVLKGYGIRPTSISKYVLGMIQLYPQLKYNAFKPLLVKLSKLEKNNTTLIA